MTAFSARILTLIASLPLLLPTGVCLCDAAVEGSAQTVCDVSTLGCCPDCHHSDEPSPPCQKPCDGHSPLCPAAKLESSHWTKPVASVAIDFVPTVVSMIADPVDVGSVSTTAHVSASFWPSAPPRYLSLCALLF